MNKELLAKRQIIQQSGLSSTPTGEDQEYPYILQEALLLSSVHISYLLPW